MQAEIVVLPGDGIGPEVTAAALSVLKDVARRYGHQFNFVEHDIGGIAIDKTGEPLPASTLAACQKADAVLLGAVGGPKWSDPNAKVRPEQGLLALRKGLGLYANLRPVRPHPAALNASPIKPHLLTGVDIVVVRELTVDIEARELRTPSGDVHAFPLDAFARTCLMQGVDELGYLLLRDPQISKYEERFHAS